MTYLTGMTWRECQVLLAEKDVGARWTAALSRPDSQEMLNQVHTHNPRIINHVSPL